MGRASVQAALTSALRWTPRLYERARSVARATRRGLAPVRLLYFAHFCVRDHGTNNVVELAPDVRAHGVRIHLSGDDNRVSVGTGASLASTTIRLQGSGNTVEIGSQCQLAQVGIVCEDDLNRVLIGERTRIAGSTELAAIEGTEIAIGRDCLFSGRIHFRTGDSHSVMDLQGSRINPSASISLGEL